MICQCLVDQLFASTDNWSARHWLDLPTSRAQFFSRARSSSGRCFMFSAAKANKRARVRLVSPAKNRNKWRHFGANYLRRCRVCCRVRVSSLAEANYRNRKSEAEDFEKVKPLANHDILLKVVQQLLTATKSHDRSKKCILFLFTKTMTTSRFTYHFYSNHTSLIWLCTIELTTWHKCPFQGFKRTV